MDTRNKRPNRRRQLQEIIESYSNGVEINSRPKRIKKSEIHLAFFNFQGNLGNFEKSRFRFSKKAFRPSTASSVP